MGRKGKGGRKGKRKKGREEEREEQREIKEDCSKGVLPVLTAISINQ